MPDATTATERLLNDAHVSITLFAHLAGMSRSSAYRAVKSTTYTDPLVWCMANALWRMDYELSAMTVNAAELTLHRDSTTAFDNYLAARRAVDLCRHLFSEQVFCFNPDSLAYLEQLDARYSFAQATFSQALEK